MNGSRIGGGSLLIVLCSSLWLGATAQAAGSEWLMDSGAALLRYTRARHLDAPRTLRLNGAALRILSGSTDDPLATVLDVFQVRCRALSQGFGLPALPRAALRRIERAGAQPLFEPVLRAEHGARGYLGCLDPAARGLAPGDWLARLQSFVRSGDLAALGELRFVWAMREGALTSYVAVWNEGSLPLRALFPAQGDAPGADAPGMPRPPESRRLLSAYVEDAEPLLVSYRSELEPARVETSYRAALIDGGFAVRPLRVAPVAHGPTCVLSIEHQQTRARALAVVTEASGGGSAITLLPLPSASARNAEPVHDATRAARAR